MAERQRGHWSWADIVRSMAVLVIPALLLAGFAALKRGDQDPVREVSYDQELAGARQQAPYPVLAPVGLGGGWQATSVRLTGVGEGRSWWHMGWLSPQDIYVGLEQSDDDRSDLLDELFEGTKPDGSAQISGTSWDRLQETGDDEPDQAIVRTVDGVTTVVLGSGGYGQLEAFAATLTAD